MINKFLTIILIFACILLTSCGGGTTGTGDILSPDTRVHGVIKDQNGQPLPGVEVTVTSTGDSATTDQSGSFDITTNLPDQNPELLISNDSVELIVPLGQIESEDSEVKVSVIIDSKDKSVTLESIEVTALNPYTGQSSSSSSASSQNSSSSSASSRPQAKPVPVQQKSLFKGIVVFEDGTRVPGAKIILLPQNKTTKSNSNGEFSLEAPTQSGKSSVQITYGNAKGQISIGNLPANQAVVVNMKVVIKFSVAVNNEGAPTQSTSFDLIELAIKKRK